MDYMRIPGWEYYLGNALQQHGQLDVHFIIGQLQKKQHLEILPQVKIIKPLFSLPDFYFFSPNILKRELLEINPDYVMAVNLKNIQVFFAALWKRNGHYKLILKEHAPRTFLRKRYFWLYPFYLGWLKLQGRYLQKRLDALIAISPAQEHFFLEHCQSAAPRFIIPSGVDTHLFRPLPQIKKEKGIIYIGRYFYTKLKIYLPVVERLAKKFPDWHFVFAGEGPWRDRILDLQKKHPYQIIELGYLNHAQLPNLINRYEIGVLPSTQTEPFGLTSLEMQSCGLPVVVSNLDGLRSTVKNEKTGLVVDSNALLLEQALQRLIKNEGLRHELGKNARLCMETESDWSIIAERTAEVILGLGT